MHTPEKSYKDEEHLPIRWMPQEVPEQQIKKSWDAIFNAIIEENASRKWVGTVREGVEVIGCPSGNSQTYRHIPCNPNSLV